LLHALPFLTLSLFLKSQSTHAGEGNATNASEGYDVHSPSLEDGVNIKAADFHLGQTLPSALTQKIL
jgi:hypothetical protein